LLAKGSHGAAQEDFVLTFCRMVSIRPGIQAAISLAQVW
jgi:hypothetical protein